MASLNCSESARDDRFARSFIYRVYQRDNSVLSQLEPRSLLREFAAKRLAALLDSLPPPPVSIHLVHRERLLGMDEAPPISHELTYLIDGASRQSRVAILLVPENGRTYVEEIRVVQTGPAH